MMTLKLSRDDLELLMIRQERIEDPTDTLWGTRITMGNVHIELGEPA